MKNIMEFAKNQDEKLFESEAQKEQPDQTLLEIVENANSKVRSVTGIDTSSASVESLPGDIAGQYHLPSEKITLDQTLLASGDEATITHVMIHEATHKMNKKRGDDEVIKDVDLEEALTETVTAETTGQILAYRQHMHLIPELASAAQTTRGKIINLFKEGRNGEINAMLAKKENPESAPQALAA